MRRSTGSSLVGLLLICAGALFLLQNFGIANFVTGTIWALLFAVAGLVFVGVFALNRDNWWAIIPGGALFTLAAIAGFSDVNGFETGSLLFIGLAMTFALVALLPANGQHMTWPWIPAGILFVFGALILFNTSQWGRYLWPVMLIVVGAVIILRPRLHR